MKDVLTAERTRALRTLAGAPVSLVRASTLGEGGEARVVSVPGRVDLVAKLYRHPRPEHARKLAQMLADPPALADAGASLAWPREPLVDAAGQVVGFVMPRAHGVKVFELFNPATRRALEHRFHWALLHRVAGNLAAALDALHARGYVVGDVNESNLLVNPAGSVTLVDTDSFQVPDPIGGGWFRARVGRPEYTPPELQGLDFGSVDRTPAHDRFGLAVVIFQLLMEGTHPFAVRTDTGEESVTVEERIRAGRFAYLPGDDIRPPRMAPPFEALDERLRDLAVRAFHAGHAEAYARPTAAEWRDGLRAAEAELVTCKASGQHRYAPHLVACPWCRRKQLLGGRDPFPLRQELPAAPRRVQDRAADALAGPSLPPMVTLTPKRPLARMVIPRVPGHILLDPLTWLAPAVAFLALQGVSLFPLLLGVVFFGVRLARRPGKRNLKLIGAVSAVITWLVIGIVFSAQAPVFVEPGASLPNPPQEGFEPYFYNPTAGSGPALSRSSQVGIGEVTLEDPADENRLGRLPGEIGQVGGFDVLRDITGYLQERGECCVDAVVHVTVSADGIPVPASIEVKQRGDPIFEASIKRLVATMRFTPAQTPDGGMVSARVRFPITITADGDAQLPEEP